MTNLPTDWHDIPLYRLTVMLCIVFNYKKWDGMYHIFLSEKWHKSSTFFQQTGQDSCSVQCSLSLDLNVVCYWNKSPLFCYNIFSNFEYQTIDHSCMCWNSPRLLHQQKIPLVPMGILAPGSTHAWPSAQIPIDTSGNFSAHMSERGEGGKKYEFSGQFSRHFRRF